MRHTPARAAALLAASLAIAVTGAVAVANQPAPTVPAASPAAVLPQAVPAAVAPPSPVPVAVAPLRAAVVPDLMVTATRALTARQLNAVRHLRGVIAVAAVAKGDLRVGGRSLHVLGVDPSSFRAFTPRVTAVSEPLWRAVAAGDLAASAAVPLLLGQSVDVIGRARQSVRVGASADFGLADAQAVLEAGRAEALGLRQSSLLVAAPERRLSRLTSELQAVLGTGAAVQVLRPVQVTFRRPRTYRALYVLSAGYCPGLSWTVLAAIGQVESGHGRHVGPSSAGALGPMQFLPSTWAYAGVDGDGDGRADIMSPYDAVPAAALYLCRAGAGRGGKDLYAAIFSYNHADWYVKEVLALAAQYR